MALNMLMRPAPPVDTTNGTENVKNGKDLERLAKIEILRLVGEKTKEKSALFKSQGQ